MTPRICNMINGSEIIDRADRLSKVQQSVEHHVDPRETRDFYLSLQRFNAQRDEEREFLERQNQQT